MIEICNMRDLKIQSPLYECSGAIRERETQRKTNGKRKQYNKIY